MKDGERVFWPQVIANEDTEEIENESPLDLRARLFHTFNTDWNEGTALAFLNRVGAWQTTTVGGTTPDVPVNVVFGHRDEIGLHVLPVTLEEMHTEIDFWYKVQSARPSLTNYGRLAFAAEARAHNTLSVSLESGRDPHGVVDTITARELLVACSWLDAAGGSDLYICAECATRFRSRHKKKYCRWECGHVVAVKNYKRKLAALKKLLREYPKKSASEILKLLQAKGHTVNPRGDKVLVRRVGASIKGK
jgi:hypothetical protein